MEPTEEMLVDQLKPRKARAWLKTLGIGFLLFALALVLSVFTENTNLFPTVILIGSFLVPVAYVTFFYERRHLSNLSLSTTLVAFFLGGLLGVLAASFLEPLVIHRVDFGTTIVVGLIEEAAAFLAVIIISRRQRHDAEMDGLIIGAAVGMGFAAFESTGYAFTAFLASGGSLSQAVYVTLLRGILSPIGHGTWTAILAAVLFRETQNGRFRINLRVVGMYVLVSLLHGLWDGLPNVITAYLGSGLDVFVAEVIVGGGGLSILWLRWREAIRLQLVTPRPSTPGETVMAQDTETEPELVELPRPPDQI